MTEPDEYELARAMARNAAGKRLNMVAAVIAFMVVLIVGAPYLLAVAAALVVYAAAAARTMFDAAETERVAARLRDRAR